MALIKLGPMVAGIRGALGGVVFARNRGGNFARNNTYPIDPATPAQVEARTRLANLQTYWANSLDAGERTAWTDLADATTFINALGEEYRPTGLNLFIRTNSQRLIAGEEIVDAAPDHASYGLPTFTIEYVVGTGIQVSAFTGGDPEMGDLNVYLSRAKTDAVNFFKGPFNYYGTHPDSDFVTLPLTIVDVADLIANRRYFVRVIGIGDSGAVSNSSIYPVDVGALA